MGSPLWSRVGGRTYDTRRDPRESNLFQKDCITWKSPMLVQFMRNCTPWEGLVLERFMEDWSRGKV